MTGIEADVYYLVEILDYLRTVLTQEEFLKIKIGQVAAYSGSYALQLIKGDYRKNNSFICLVYDEFRYSFKINEKLGWNSTLRLYSNSLELMDKFYTKKHVN